MNYHILFIFCKQLKTKTYDFKLRILENNYDVIAITESWLNENIFSSEIFDDRYTVSRKDRNRSMTCRSEGGDVILAVLKKFNYHLIQNVNKIYEQLWVKLHSESGKSIFLSLVYFSQIVQFSKYDDYFRICSDMVDNHLNSTFLFLGW